MYRRLCVLFSILFGIMTAHLLGQTPSVGLIQQSIESDEGYTLFTSSASKNTYLIDNCGNVVNQWSSSYSPGISVYLREDGSIFRAGRTLNSNINAGGSGGIIQQFSWEGDLLWEYEISDNDKRQHHDFEVLPNGNILVLAWERKSVEEASAKGSEILPSGGLYSEMILEIMPTGTNDAIVVWEWHLWDHLIQDVNPSLLNFAIINDNRDKLDINADTGNTGSDFVHCNSIDYNADLDQIMLSSRNHSEIWVIDHSTSISEAASSQGGIYGRGGGFLFRWGNPQIYKNGDATTRQLYGQHDAHWIDNNLPDAGKIMLFNNGAQRPDGNYSEVFILDPLDQNGIYNVLPDGTYFPESPSRIYEDRAQFFSNRISGAHQLSSGNLLICEGNDGRIFEVDDQDSIVWEYIVPERNGIPVSQGTPPSANSTFRSYRYAYDYPAFAERQIETALPIELNPINENCMLFDQISNTTSLSNSPPISIKNNVISSNLEILESPLDFQLYIFDLSGRSVFNKIFADSHPTHSIDMSDLPKGAYLANFFVEGKVNQTFKIFKL